ncbi:MAG: tetratricopeptide repeat protein [Rhodobacteraceae bacterium]|nr:tetratricopeptide repeat protein [Paracoccaceae bacterium]
MRVIPIFVLLFPLAAMAQSCPPLPERVDEHNRLMEAARLAPDAESGRIATNRLWQFWATAPDQKAQKLLDDGMARRASYDFDAAGKAFDALIAYCPDYAEGYNQRAFIHFLRDEYERALEDLETTLELQPDHIAAMTGMALTLQRLGRIKASQSVLRQALKLNPWLPERALLIDSKEL